MPKLPSGRKPLVSRNVKVDVALWDRAMQIADERDETVSDVVRRAVAQYVKRHDVGRDFDAAVSKRIADAKVKK